MYILREGLDKISFTVREKGRKDYAYPKDVSLMYADRLSKLKFSDRYAVVIHFSKYPWNQWVYQGQSKATYAVEYFLRLDGMRQMRVMLNCMRLYNIKNKLPLSKGLLFDDNVVIPSHIFGLTEFVELVQAELPHFKDDYLELREKVFGDIVTREDLVIDTHQLEVVTEGIGLHTSDVSTTFKDFARCQSFKVYHDHTNTHYLNTAGKKQLKIYQKAVGVLRLEATFNTRPYDFVFNWKKDPVIISRQIQAEFEDLLEDMGIPSNWYEIRTVSRDDLVWLFADALSLRDQSDIIRFDLMKTLLVITSWSSNRNNRNLTRQLVRKKLLEPYARGKYRPTENLQVIQELFNKLDRMESLHKDDKQDA